VKIETEKPGGREERREGKKEGTYLQHGALRNLAVEGNAVHDA